MANSEYRQYLFEDFIRSVNLKVDALRAAQLISAVPIFVQDSENFKQRFTLTVYRDPNTKQLKFTIFLGDGNVMGETMNEEKLKLIIGKYIIAEITNETLMSHIDPNQLASTMQAGRGINSMMGGGMPGLPDMPPMGSI